MTKVDFCPRGERSAHEFRFRSHRHGHNGCQASHRWLRDDSQIRRIRKAKRPKYRREHIAAKSSLRDKNGISRTELEEVSTVILSNNDEVVLACSTLHQPFQMS